MSEKQLNEDAILDDIVTTPYKYGFTTDIATEEFEKGLIPFIIARPSYLTKMEITRFRNNLITVYV